MVNVEIDGVRYIPYVERAEPTALDVVFEHQDFDAPITVREFFRVLLTDLWLEGDSFSGKRPWGNGGWEYDVIYALIKAGFIDGEVEYDEWGCVQESRYDRRLANQFIVSLITTMCLGESNVGVSLCL